jgi:hypothetical protein
MKKTIFGIFSLVVFSFLFVPAVLAAESFATAPQTEAIDKNHLEGWIVRIDYNKSYFRLLDPRGFERRVVTKPGMIGDYKIGDKVRVEIDPGYKRASSIQKLY